MSFDELNKTDLGYNGFTDFEAGASSRQSEIDALIDMVKTSADSEMYLFDVLQKVEKERDDLQKKIDDALEAMYAESTESWGLWKEKANMYDQGASDAYEKSYWILKGNKND